jgi:hypothetical protein
VSFKLTNVPVGGQATLVIQLPAEAWDPNNAESFITSNGQIKPGTNWFKIQNGLWKGILPISVDMTSQTISVTLTDGGPGDADGTANGVIIDPGCPGWGMEATPAEAVTTQPSKNTGPFGCFINTAKKAHPAGLLSLLAVLAGAGLYLLVRRRGR